VRGDWLRKTAQRRLVKYWETARERQLTGDWSSCVKKDRLRETGWGTVVKQGIATGEA
jgi:hypothetical protein